MYAGRGECGEDPALYFKGPRQLVGVGGGAAPPPPDEGTGVA
jgi:hypothetical protein